MFKKAEKPDYRKAIKRNIIMIYPEWFFPLLDGRTFLIVSFNTILLFLLVLFCIVSFIWLPIQTKKECLSCPQRDKCPHYSEKSKEK